MLHATSDKQTANHFPAKLLGCTLHMSYNNISSAELSEKVRTIKMEARKKLKWLNKGFFFSMAAHEAAQKFQTLVSVNVTLSVLTTASD